MNFHPCSHGHRPGNLLHRIHVFSIYANIYHQYTPKMLAFFSQHHGSVMEISMDFVLRKSGEKGATPPDARAGFRAGPHGRARGAQGAQGAQGAHGRSRRPLEWWGMNLPLLFEFIFISLISLAIISISWWQWRYIYMYISSEPQDGSPQTWWQFLVKPC